MSAIQETGKTQRQWFKSGPDEPRNELMRVRDFHQNLHALKVFGLQRGTSTGWRSVDELYTVRPREWTLITGIPGHGKSTWLDNLMINLAMSEESWHFAVFSAENWPLERHAATLAAQFKRRPIEAQGDAEFNDASVWLDLAFTFICPRQDDFTIDRVLDLAHLAIQQDSLIKGLVIDPWNELDHSRPANMNETEYISRCLTKIRRFARTHEVHIFLVAHPTKMQRQKTADGSESNVYPVPTPYDVSGSAHFRNKADCCICVWRDVLDEKHETKIYVQKIRFREVGKVGCCSLTYDPYASRFIDPRPSIDDYMRRREREPGEEG